VPRVYSLAHVAFRRPPPYPVYLVVQWILNAFFHAALLFTMVYMTFMSNPTEADGTSGGLWGRGAVMNFVLVVVVNLKVC
jgi:hypothetical protein